MHLQPAKKGAKRGCVTVTQCICRCARFNVMPLSLRIGIGNGILTHVSVSFYYKIAQKNE